MKHKLLNILTILALILAPAGIFVSNASAALDCGDPNSSKGQVFKGIGQTGADCSSAGGVDSAIGTAVKILSIVVGIAAVIMVIISGFKYITSGGDSAKVGSAKTTLIYALVGIAVAALAQVMVHYVINSATGTTTPCPTNSKIVVSDPACST
jgi:uncharacterized membrane protein YuzA (DUF378 family)